MHTTERSTSRSARRNLSDRRERHPEKAHRPDAPSPRKPPWIRARIPQGGVFADTLKIVQEHGLSTVCQEAGCPNVGECWSQGHATFMVMGEICTRACTFCNVATGRPDVLDPFEPARVAQAVQRLGLRHVVITSVDRDDLDDGGAEHIACTVRAVRRHNPGATVEILTPDFRRKEGALDRILVSKPDVFNHNLETVPRLYREVRPGSRYRHSLDLLRQVKERDPAMFTKSGLMVGLGESVDEVLEVMDHMRDADIDFLTIGQYLQPSLKHHRIERYVHPDEFADMEQAAYRKGFLMVSASPLTRSSYHAGEDFERLRARRLAQLSA